MLKFIIYLSILIFFNNCKEPDKDRTGADNAVVLPKSRLDSLKWLFYAYSFQETALFIKQEGDLKLPTVSCDIKVDTSFCIGKDSSEIHFSFSNPGYRFGHIFPGVGINGFIYHSGIANPLAGMVKFDNFDNWDFIKKDNHRADSSFKEYLKTVENSKLSNWLSSEVKKRNVSLKQN